MIAMQTDSFGQETRVCALDGIRVSETLMPAGLRLREHAHEAGQICFVLEGSYRERLAAGDRVLRAGMLHVRAPGEMHADDFNGDEDVVALLISVDRRRWLPLSEGGPRRMLSDLAGDLHDELARSDDASRTAIEGLSLLAMARLARQVRFGEPAWLSDAESFIERRHFESLTLARVARAIGIPRTTLAVAFRRYRATSVGQAIRRARVHAAGELLARTGIPLAEIAVRTGFHDQPHFTRVFQEVTGETPAIYRAKLSK
jgi:AraC family transcriptional regulator